MSDKDSFEQEAYLSDLVKRLRRYDTRLEIAMSNREVADVIDRLRATVDWSEVERLRNANDLLDEAVKVERLQAEIERLRKALKIARNYINKNNCYIDAATDVIDCALTRSPHEQPPDAPKDDQG